jgi:hypothetical protein
MPTNKNYLFKDCVADKSSSVSVFLDRASLESAVHDALGQLPCSTPTKALVHMVLAFGIHFLHCEGRRERLPELQHNPLLHFTKALKLKDQLLNDIFSVQSLQVRLDVSPSKYFTRWNTNYGTKALVAMV